MPSQLPTSRRAASCRGRRYYRVRRQFRPAEPVQPRRDRGAHRLLRQYAGAARRRLGPEPGFGDLLARAREACARRLRAPGRAVRAPRRAGAPAARGLARHPLFQVLFGMVSTPWLERDLPGLAWSPSGSTRAVKFDLSLQVSEMPHGLDAGRLRRGPLRAGDGGTLARWPRRSSRGARRPGAAPRGLPLLLEAERHHLFAEWGAPAPRVAPGRRLQPSSRRRPPRRRAAGRAGAVGSGGERVAMTYAELERRAGRLARHRLSRGVGPGVGVYLRVPGSTSSLRSSPSGRRAPPASRSSSGCRGSGSTCSSPTAAAAAVTDDFDQASRRRSPRPRLRRAPDARDTFHADTGRSLAARRAPGPQASSRWPRASPTRSTLRLDRQPQGRAGRRRSVGHCLEVARRPELDPGPRAPLRPLSFDSPRELLLALLAGAGCRRRPGAVRRRTLMSTSPSGGSRSRPADEPGTWRRASGLRTGRLRRRARWIIFGSEPAPRGSPAPGCARRRQRAAGERLRPDGDDDHLDDLVAAVRRSGRRRR